jgi:hypothetical protein
MRTAKKIAIVWSGANSPPNSFRFCRAKLVIGWLLLGSLGAVLDRRGRRVALSNLRVAFGDEISAKGRAQIVRESYDCHLLHGGVSQKRAFDFGGRNIFTDTYDDVFRVVAN